MTPVPLRRGAAVVALAAATLTARGATTQPADGGLQPREIAARAQASLLVVRAIGAQGDTLGEGTGFVVAEGGTFVTNYHVVEPAVEVEVEPLAGGTTRRVLLMAADPLRDLVILRAPDVSASVLPLGDDSAAVIGDRVYVMGNPMGMRGTFADGLLSARRPLQGTAMLQISAPISPGSSGGPVMNERAEVIGVATMMVVGGQNLSLAVPTRYLVPLLTRDRAEQPFAASTLPRRQAEAVLAGGLPRPIIPPRGTNIWRQQVLGQIARADSMMRSSGLRLDAPVRVGAARQGERSEETLRLEAGTRYFVIARCDDDCSGLDLGVFDADGRPVATDDAEDDTPAVMLVPRESGTYRAVVSMARCSAEPCAYGVAVFRKELPLAARGARR